MSISVEWNSVYCSVGWYCIVQYMQFLLTVKLRRIWENEIQVMHDMNIRRRRCDIMSACVRMQSNVFRIRFQQWMRWCSTLRFPRDKKADSTYWNSILYMLQWCSLVHCALIYFPVAWSVLYTAPMSAQLSIMQRPVLSQMMLATMSNSVNAVHVEERT